MTESGLTGTIGTGLIPSLGGGTDSAHEYGKVQHLGVVPLVSVLVAVPVSSPPSYATAHVGIGDSLDDVLVGLGELIDKLVIVWSLS